jgi:hypothetical protein
MKNHLIALGFGTFSLIAAVAETPAAPSPIDYKAREKSVEALKEHLAAREERFAVLRQDLLEMDARLEKQVDSIVKRLSQVTDSNDSRTKVANMKDDVINGLMRSIWIYRQKRVAVFENIRKDNVVPKEELEKTLKAFDDHITKRVAQVMELAKSYPGHQDLDKYESYGTSYYNSYEHETTRVSEDWKQNRRDNTSGRQARKEVLASLDKAIETNQSRRTTIAGNLRTSNMAEQERGLMQEELGRIDALIDQLRNQRRELVIPDAAGGREIGADEAHDVAQMLDDARADLSRDFSEIMRKYSELETERARIYGLKSNLDARQEWLKSNPPPAE